MKKIRKQRARVRKRNLEAMTLIEVMVVMVIMALVATAAGFAIVPQITKARVKQTSADAKAVASAAELFLTENDDCPDVEKLVSEKILDKKKNTKDAWGNDFTIECDEDGATVKSAGPDEQMGTEDDIQ
jgi:general secretion pathway protein G